MDFFSDKNMDLVYGIVRDKIIQQTNYDIDSSPKYYQNMKYFRRPDTNWHYWTSQGGDSFST